jgi:hypothetical protein
MENNIENIKLKVQELAETTPGINNVSYGFKFIGGEQTNELCIMYGVEEKKPLSELSPEEILPSEIVIGDQVLRTDVFRIGRAELLACNAACGQIAGPNSAVNRAVTRPLKGGLSITSTNLAGFVGTMGFIGVHTETQTLVGVTNNHVTIQDAFYTSERNLTGVIKNEYSPIDYIYQNGEGIPPPANIVGQSLRYVPILKQGTGINYVDGAIFSLAAADVNIATSYQQAGVTDYTLPLPFASTAEIDGMLTVGSPYYNPMIYSSGRTTGPKGGASCPMRIFSLFSSVYLQYKLQGGTGVCQFNDQIVYVKPENDPSLSTICAYPVAGGDSGSALIADFGGVRKIIGLVFAGATNPPIPDILFYGFANRIDRVASELGIEAWNGTAKGYVDPSSITYKTTTNGSSNKILNCGGTNYWQVGLTTLSNPC